MKQETKVVILVVLIVILGAVAYYVAFRSKVPEVVAFLPGAPTTTLPAKGKVTLPNADDVAFLKVWLAGRDKPATKVDAPFGLPMAAKPGVPGASAGASSAPTDVLHLDGVLRVGLTLKAIIAGEAYGPGEAIRYTTYTVTAVTAGGATIRSNSGQELVLVLQK